MIDLLDEALPWIRALHIIVAIAWMAGLFYLPRLFIYHTAAAPGSEMSETFKVMERRLLRAIMNPAMIAVFLTGGLILMAAGGPEWDSGWLLVKLACAVGLLALHIMMAHWRRQFADDANTRSGKFYRVVNEAPTVLMIAIVIMAVVKPF